MKVDFIHSKEKTNTLNNLLLPSTGINNLIYIWIALDDLAVKVGLKETNQVNKHDVPMFYFI